jgi:hypothetical protein
VEQTVDKAIHPTDEDDGSRPRGRPGATGL